MFDDSKLGVDRCGQCLMIGGMGDDGCEKVKRSWRCEMGSVL